MAVQETASTVASTLSVSTRSAAGVCDYSSQVDK